MPKKKNNIIYLPLPALVLICAGCTVERPVESLFPPNQATKTAAKADMTGRFQDHAAVATSNPAAQSTMELSAKYTKVVEEMAALKAENQKLIEENQQLQETISPCQTNLAQAQKELAEANDLLIEMRIEMNNWKTNILGFREEMRNAENAQLDALVKILEVLGGQAKTDAPDDSDTQPATTSTSPLQADPAQPAVRAASAPKKTNG